MPVWGRGGLAACERLARPARVAAILAACDRLARPARPARVAAILAVFAIAAGAGAGAAQGATIRLRLTGASTAVPATFFGLGIEVSEVPDFAGGGAAVDRALSLVRPRLEPSMPIRVGGYSADEAYWQATQEPAPQGVFEIGSDLPSQLAGLAARDRLRVTVAVNLAVHSPSMAAQFAQDVSRALAPAGLAGVAIGDEPDLYGREPWFDSERIASTLATTPTSWTAAYAPSNYRADFLAYANALAAAVPGVPLAGPEAAGLAPGWLASLAGLGGTAPAALTVHRYPSSCRPPNTPMYPRISLLLAERSSAGLAALVTPALAAARQSGIPLVVSEINSASCAGPPGVTDSFATALWAPDVLFELLRAGVAAVNWHLRPYRLNSPFELAAGGIEPQPELYGLALFAQMLGPRARLLGVQMSVAPAVHVKAWAVRSRRAVSLLLINKGAQAERVSASLGPALGPASLERLSAPAVSATTGVTLGGRSIGPDGLWHGRRRVFAVRPRAGAYRVRLPGYSAALLTTA